jgi:hypothetical protein
VASCTLTPDGGDTLLDAGLLRSWYNPRFPSSYYRYDVNGDGFNDVLHVNGLTGEDFNYRVYDRWGNILFETSDARGARLMSDPTSGEANDLKRWQYRIFGTVWVTYFAYYLCRFNLPIVKGKMVEGYGWNQQTVGWAFTSLALAYAFGQLVNGQLADRFGSRRMASLGVLGSVVMNLTVFILLMVVPPDYLVLDLDPVSLSRAEVQVDTPAPEPEVVPPALEPNLFVDHLGVGTEVQHDLLAHGHVFDHLLNEEGQPVAAVVPV